MHLTLTLVFFVPYVLCEVPSNLLLAKFNKASWYMGTLVVSWGIVSVHGIVLLIHI
jgi:hypothetical protein